MKILLVLLAAALGIIVLSVGGLFVASNLESSRRMESSLELSRPPAEVWAWITEPERLTQWVSWLLEVKRTGELAPGAKRTWVMEDKNNGGQRMEIAVEVVEVQAPLHLRARLSVPMAFSGTVTYDISDLGGGRARLHSVSEYEFDNGFAKLLSPFIMSQAKNKMLADAQQLARLVEAAPIATSVAASAAAAN